MTAPQTPFGAGPACAYSPQAVHGGLERPVLRPATETPSALGPTPGAPLRRIGQVGRLRFFTAAAAGVGWALLLLPTLFAQTAAEEDSRPIKTSLRNPDAIAVVVGIAKYQHPDVPEVEFAVNDAQAIKRVLIDTLGYREDRVLLRTNEDASVGRLKSLMRQELPARVIAGKSDVFVYYSGHGAPNADTREASLIPWDYDPRYALTSDSAYPLKEFYSDLGKLKARSVTVTLEACFSGRSESGMVLKDVSPPYIEVPLPELPTGLVVTATGPREVATWDREHRHGLLTYYFLRALHGEAADEKGRVTAAQLERYLKEKVPQAARELGQRNQTPQVIAQDSTRVLAQLPISALKTGQAEVVQTFGSLEITVDVGGELLIDGVPQGIIPEGQAFRQAKINAWRHQIEIRKEGYRPVSEQVIVLPDQPLRKTYQLAAILPEKAQIEVAYGLIQVMADAGGTLYLDGERAAELTPFAKYTTGRMEAGPHRVRVERPGYQAAEQQVLVLPSQTAVAELKLALIPGAPPGGPAQMDARRPTFETESYRVIVESVRLRTAKKAAGGAALGAIIGGIAGGGKGAAVGNSITVTLIFESLSESGIALSWGWSFESDGGLYLLADDGEKWVAQRRPGLMARDEAGVAFTPGIGQVNLLPGTRIKTNFLFSGSGAGKSFTLVSREGAPRSGRDIVIHGLVPN